MLFSSFSFIAWQIQLLKLIANILCRLILKVKFLKMHILTIESISKFYFPLFVNPEFMHVLTCKQNIQSWSWSSEAFLFLSILNSSIICNIDREERRCYRSNSITHIEISFCFLRQFLSKNYPYISFQMSDWIFKFRDIFLNQCVMSTDIFFFFFS